MKNRIIIDLADHMSEIINSQPHILSSKFKDENEDEQVINVLDNNMFSSYFEYFFYSYSMISFKDLTDEEVIFRFNNMWRIFQMEEKENLEKIVQGYYWDYVPVYNYDRTERWKDVKTGNETDKRILDFAEKTETTTPEGSQITTSIPSGTYKDTTHYDDNVAYEEVTTMDSPNYRPKTKNTDEEREDYTERSYDDFQEETIQSYDEFTNTVTHSAHKDKDDNTHTYNEVTDTHEGHLYGNIGVTTNVQMIEGEFGLRIHNLGYEYVKKFFDKYFVML